MTTKTERPAIAIHASLFERYGPLIGGSALSKALGYSSLAAFRQALMRGQVPIKVFGIDHRRGKFAFTEDVTTWLESVRQAPN